MFPLDWQKSSHSGEGANCLYIAAVPDGTVRIKESDDPRITIGVSQDAFRALIRGVKAGEWDDLV
ncbi:MULTISPECIES: DUF397 domain-containing protein [Streptomyces]|uniref:DUF397 domain-containing protein n=2 Tax=Streptomyces TaxID=1883 RepID=A0A420V7W0_9ACTN|nr:MULTISPECIES: DUF397 domain-containing protein [Streptomyces]KNE82252.1 hypothetical protein ADZ36_12210 [Streptomyces fradiae]OFA56697.1 DUF397 domain-containing protein [Streptomyces fradiae]PQM22851.1 DUF397 domain-containing protein [Streptomyces xinghaiensis]RKM98021.1 DUF397 domain-containing protein [Streptomyces xinghaiensis]RNC73841.1 DUF397 domain-containing protein [Streptomyces xinghaiensis]